MNRPVVGFIVRSLMLVLPGCCGSAVLCGVWEARSGRSTVAHRPLNRRLKGRLWPGVRSVVEANEMLHTIGAAPALARAEAEIREASAPLAG